MRTNKRREALMAKRAERHVHGGTHAEIDLGLAVLCALGPREPMTQQEIADVCGCTDERIRQIEHIALAKLRRQRPLLQALLEQCA